MDGGEPGGGSAGGSGGAAVGGEGSVVSVGGQQLLITGAGSDGQGTIMMSAEDAAQFFQNAGIQWDPSGQGVIIGTEGENGGEAVVAAGSQDIGVPLTAAEGDAAATIASLSAAVDGGIVQAGPDGSGGLVDAEGNPIVAAGADGVEGAAPTEGNVIYIDPNDPQGTAAALAQNGLMLLEDGSIVPQDSVVAAATAAVGGAGDAVEATAAGEAASGVSVPVSEPGLLSPTGADFDPSAAAAAVMGQTGATPATGPKQELITLNAADPAAIAASGAETAEEVLAKQETVETLQAIQAGQQILGAEDSKLNILPEQLQQLTQPQQPAPPPNPPPPQAPVIAPTPPKVMHRQTTVTPHTTAAMPQQQQPLTTPTASSGGKPSASSITVGPDQKQVFYSVTYEDGKTQQYMMLCPKEMDQDTLIQTLVKQISADPNAKGKKTIRIQKPASTQGTPGMGATKGGATGSGSMANKGAPIPKFPPRVAEPRARGRPTKDSMGNILSKTTPTTRAPQQRAATLQTTPVTFHAASPAGQQVSQQAMADKIGDILSAASVATPSTPGGGQQHVAVIGADVQNIVDQSEAFESVAQPDPTTGELMTSPESGGTRVYVRCCYCTQFKSTLNSDTWEAILNHILPVVKEEIQTSFYGDLGKHFTRCVRMQINGKQIVRSRDPLTGAEKRTPQCEVVLTHALVCKRTKKEFVVGTNPDATFVADLAKHVRMIQPGSAGRGNSLLCIFCNQPFTYEDYLRHIQPHLEPILATLSCFAGAYCASSYETTIKATTHCQLCSEPEPADLRFLPCTKFSTEYRCLTKLQFAIECFRENFGDSGFMRLNTSNLAKCSVCKNMQNVYCAVFHITTNTGDPNGGGEIDTTLSVCVNCQKQFINIVMKEQGFDDRLKLFQLRNMEQLCSCLRVILGQAKTVCDEKKVLLYTVEEGTAASTGTASSSAVHTVRTADVTQLSPVTKLMAMPEMDIRRATTKAYYICDLCLFTVDLTSLIIPPGPSSNPQKNDMQLSIVLEHLIPHTDSLMTVVASSAANKTINLKFEIMARVSPIPNQPGSRKIVLSLQKKFKSQTSAMEVMIEKDEERTMAQVRAGIKAERKQYVSVRPSNLTVQNNPATPANATQLIDVNKFVEQQRGKMGVLSMCGCNTSLLNAYTECRLCGKFCFPDFRLAGNPGIELCENCVETVLQLCLPSDPEQLEVGEECLALRQERNTGHRLVLQNNVKKWLSVDGVTVIKKTIESYDSVKSSDCGSFFTDALKQHLVANLKTCHNDPEITAAVTGFCVTDDFFASSEVHSEEAKADEETAAALASLSAQIGMPIKQQGAQQATPQSTPGQPRPARQRQIEVKILARRPPVQKIESTPKRTPLQLQRMPQRGSAVIGSARRVISNGLVSSVDKRSSLTPGVDDEESVSAIQKFLDSTDAAATSPPSKDGSLKVPPGVKITAAGRGVVNIRAVADTAKTPVPRGRGRGGATGRGRGRGPGRPPGSGNKATPVSPRKIQMRVEDEVNFDSGDDGSDADEEALRELTEAFEQEEAEAKAAKINKLSSSSVAAVNGKSSVSAVTGSHSTTSKTVTTPSLPVTAVPPPVDSKVVKAEVGVGASMPNPLAEGDEWTPPGMVVSESTPTLTQSNKRPLSDSTETTPSSVERPGKRQRKEKKIFDL